MSVIVSYYYETTTQDLTVPQNTTARYMDSVGREHTIVWLATPNSDIDQQAQDKIPALEEAIAEAEAVQLLEE